MSSLPQIDYAPLDPETYRHQARLLLAQHCARPVEFEGREKFIQSVTSGPCGGRIEMTVYLMGDPAPIDSSRIAIKEAKA